MSHDDPIDGTPLERETPWQRTIGYVATCTGFAVTAGTIPQAISVWSGHGAGVSLFTWTILLVNMVCWLLYGVAHRRWPIIAVNIPGVLSAAAVVAGLLVVR